MLFNLEADTGDVVTGYLVPDAFSVVPTIRVASGGKDVLTFVANEVRESLVLAGRHETGRCGFRIDSGALSGLAEMKDLEVFDAETGILVYRRSPAQTVPRKVLRVETHLFPMWSLDEALRPHFQYFAKGIEAHGRETVSQLFLLNEVHSVYLSGRILYRNYAHYIDGGFDVVLLIQDPYLELAERLLILSKIRQFGTQFLNFRDSIGMAAAINFAEQLMSNDAHFQNEKVLARSLRSMAPEVSLMLSNPLVRELTCSTPDEMPGRNAIAASLDCLGSAAVVGFRSDADSFRNAIAELCGLDVGVLPSIAQSERAPSLALLLKSAGEVEMILEKDLELYQYILEASLKETSAIHD